MIGVTAHAAVSGWPSVKSADIGSPLLRAHRAGRRANLLVVRGHGRDLLVVELLGDGGHQVRAVLAKTALPHVQCERDILCVLSGKVRHWRNALAVWSMTIVTPQDAFAGVAVLRELLTFFDDCSIR